MDFFEERKDKFRPLGEWAFRLIKKIISESNDIVFSTLTEHELKSFFSEEQIKAMLTLIPEQILIKIDFTKEQTKEAFRLAKRFNIPVGDALHTVIARDNSSILITRDKHFYELASLAIIKKPEELL